jgi:tRNA threonylcarbamoyladenosine biosynthesis protein TsaE
MLSRTVGSERELMALGEEMGAELRGGEVIELTGDLGVGKTTFVKGLARGLGVTGTVNSPSFTIMKSYGARDGLVLKHYDFYRLEDAGLMRNEIEESAGDGQTVVVVEWAKGVAGILPKGRRVIDLRYVKDSDARAVSWN